MNKAINIKSKKHYDDFECKLDENYKKYENLFTNINLKSEEEKQKIIEKFMQLCVIEKESFVSDIRDAIKEIADNEIGAKLLILLIHKLQENKKKVKFDKCIHNALSEKNSIGRKITIWLNNGTKAEKPSEILDKNKKCVRTACFPEILFHELCHALHFICDGYEKYRAGKDSSTCIKNVFNCTFDEATGAWQNDEEFYNITGFVFDTTNNTFMYNPINQNSFAHAENLAIRETYNKSNVYIPLERLSEFYEKIGFYDEELNIY